MWSFSDSHLDFSQDCINFDGDNQCPTGSGIDKTDGLPDTHLGFKPAPSPFKAQLEAFLRQHEQLDEIRDEATVREDRTVEPVQLDSGLTKTLSEGFTFLEMLSESDAQIIDAKLDMLVEMDNQDREALLRMDEEDLIVFLLLI